MPAKRRAAAPRRIVYRPKRYDLPGGDPFFTAIERSVDASAPEPVFDRVSGPFAAYDEEL